MDTADSQIFLSADELERLCHPHKRADARRRFLDRATYKYALSASGQPLVFRGQFVAIARAVQTTARREPNEEALKALFSKSRK